ncbi:MAG: insulinase family protein [Clostridia bacterium]|nr:insulinase family protein [Clostridia bacterium]
MERKYQTRSGIDIYTYPNEHLGGFYISLFLKGGSMYEDEKYSGITHFLEHLSIRNINSRMGGGLYRLLDLYGLEFNASTYPEMVQFYISGAKEHFAHAVKIICMLFSPLVLTSAEIDTERLRIKAELREGDTKNSLAEFTSAILYPDTTLRLPILGTNASLDRITGKKLKELQQTLFASENIFFYLTGAVDENAVDTLMREIDLYEIAHGIKRENMAPVSEFFGKRNAAVHVKNADYTLLRFSFDMDMTKVSEAESDLLYDILFTGYNSRFFMEMSENRGICYDISGGLDRYLNIGSLYFTCEIKREKLIEAVTLSVDILREMKEKMLTQDQIISAPYVDNAYLLYDDIRELNFTFAYDCHILDSGYTSLEDRRRAYASVTPERIREVSRLIFTADNCTLTLKGAKKKIPVDQLHEILLTIDEK